MQVIYIGYFLILYVFIISISTGHVAFCVRIQKSEALEPSINGLIVQ